MDIQQILLIALFALAGVALLAVLLWPSTPQIKPDARVKAIVERRRGAPARQSVLSRLVSGEKDSRRKQIQDTLKQLEEREKQRRQRMNLRTLITQAGLKHAIHRFATKPRRELVNLRN